MSKEEGKKQLTVNDWINEVVQIKESKSGKYYIQFTDYQPKLDAFIERITAGMTIQLEDFRENLDKKFSAGFMNPEQYEKAKELTYITFVGNCPPVKEN